MGNLVRYETACRALAEAKQVDEVKDLRDKAEAMRIYAMQAKNKSLEVDAAEIRIRAERRLGEMIAEQKATVGLHKGGNPNLTPRDQRGVSDEDFPTGRVQRPVGNAGVGVKGQPAVVGDDRRLKLADTGISKDLSSRAQKLAAVPKPEFEAEVAGWRERVQQEGQRVTTRLEAAGARAQKRSAKPGKPDLVYEGEDLSGELGNIDDLIADMKDLEKENADLKERIKALTVSDLAEELDKQVRIRQGIEVRLAQEMNRANKFDNELRSYGKWTAELRKVLNIDGGRSQLTAAVRALVKHQQAAF